MSDSLRPHGLSKFLCPWDFPGNSTGVDCHFLFQRIFPTQGSNPGLSHCRQTLYCLSHQGSTNESEVAQSCPTLCDPVDCSLSGSSLHGILQARILEWVAIFFSRGSSQPRDRTWVSHIVGRCFNLWATREAHLHMVMYICQCYAPNSSHSLFPPLCPQVLNSTYLVPQNIYNFCFKKIP